MTERVAQLASRPVAVVRSPAVVRGGRVVVGVDGSARSLDALRWAAAEADARDADLDVVHAWRTPMMAISSLAPVVPDYVALEAIGHQILDSALADPALAGVRVHGHLRYDSPAAAIIDRGADAGLIVVGTRGRGRVAGALLGSVSRQILHHAPCPVVVF